MQDKSLPLLVGLDIGTSGVRAVAFTPAGEIVAEGSTSLETSYPEAGAAEQRPQDWWYAAAHALHQLASRLRNSIHRVVGIGLTGQCPTLACLDPTSGPVGPGLLYQDNRAIAESEDLILRFGAQTIHRRTGQAPSPFFLLPKLLWLSRHRQTLSPTNMVIVQPRDLIGWHLTGRIATDPTHAACTLAYDLMAQTWTTDWLEQIDLPPVSWPEILPSCSILGYLTAAAARSTGFPTETPIVLGAADSICAAYGAQAIEPGVLCEVTGTSTCLHLTIEQPVAAYAVNTYPHILPGLWYAEVGLNTTGGALSWLASLLKSSPETLVREAEAIAPGAEGLFFVPHLSRGERDTVGRRGAFIGLQLGNSSAHLTRALLEGVAYALRQRVALLEDAGYAVSRIVSCGGNARSSLWTQIKADILDRTIGSISPVDTTTWGAALLVAHTLNVSLEASVQSSTEALPSSLCAEHYRIGYRQFCRLEEIIALQEPLQERRKVAHE